MFIFVSMEKHTPATRSLSLWLYTAWVHENVTQGINCPMLWIKLAFVCLTFRLHSPRFCLLQWWACHQPSFMWLRPDSMHARKTPCQLSCISSPYIKIKTDRQTDKKLAQQNSSLSKDVAAKPEGMNSVPETFMSEGTANTPHRAGTPLYFLFASVWRDQRH